MKPLQVYVSESMLKQLKQKALDTNKTVSEIVREKLGGDVELVKSKPVYNLPKPVLNNIAETRTTNGLCKVHGVPLDDRGRCMQKGCKYA